LSRSLSSPAECRRRRSIPLSYHPWAAEDVLIVLCSSFIVPPLQRTGSRPLPDSLKPWKGERKIPGRRSIIPARRGWRGGDGGEVRKTGREPDMPYPIREDRQAIIRGAHKLPERTSIRRRRRWVRSGIGRTVRTGSSGGRQRRSTRRNRRGKRRRRRAPADRGDH